MAAPTRIKMPDRDDGRAIPNPIRWVCDHGHTHPSRNHAIRCNQRHRTITERCPGTGAFARDLAGNPRASCPVCGRSTALTQRGTIRRHKRIVRPA